jgi:hypothetical protein
MYAIVSIETRYLLELHNLIFLGGVYNQYVTGLYQPFKEVMSAQRR